MVKFWKKPIWVKGLYNRERYFIDDLEETF